MPTLYRKIYGKKIIWYRNFTVWYRISTKKYRKIYGREINWYRNSTVAYRISTKKYRKFYGREETDTVILLWHTVFLQTNTVELTVEK